MKKEIKIEEVEDISLLDDDTLIKLDENASDCYKEEDRK